MSRTPGVKPIRTHPVCVRFTDEEMELIKAGAKANTRGNVSAYLRHKALYEADEDRDARFAPGNDKIWGEGNWVKCAICPRDATGRLTYHHKNYHFSGRPVPAIPVPAEPRTQSSGSEPR